MSAMSTMRSVYKNIRAARSALKDMVRVREITKVLVRHGFGHVVKAWNMPDRGVLDELADGTDPESKHLSGFERIALVLEELGPTFVKLGQILSTRSDLIPQDLCDQLQTLQDNVAQIPSDQAREVVETELDSPIDELFDEFSDEPLASASIAQVHTARLKSGEQVVIKIQRPGIRETIESDLHILYWIANKLEETVPEAEAFDPVAITHEFERAISRELDFKFEVNNLKKFQRNFVDWPSIYIPEVHADYCTDKVMVMERLRGQKITDAPAYGHDMEEIGRQCVRMLFKMVFEDGFFHGDLHPGNLWVLDDGRIGVIDFGLVGRLNQANKDAVADLFLSIATKNNAGVARALFDVSVKRGPTDYSAFEQDVDDLMSTYFESTSLAEVDFGAYLREIIEGAIRHNLRVPSDFTMFFKSVMTVEGIGKIISPQLDLVSECRPYVETLVAERYGPQRVLRNVADTAQAFARFARQFPITATDFLDQLEGGRLNIGVENPQFDKLEQGKDVRSNRTVMTALVALLTICGTAMHIGYISTDTEPFISILGVPAFSLVSYFVAGLLGTRLVWRILISGRW